MPRLSASQDQREYGVLQQFFIALANAAQGQKQHRSGDLRNKAAVCEPECNRRQCVAVDEIRIRDTHGQDNRKQQRVSALLRTPAIE